MQSDIEVPGQAEVYGDLCGRIQAGDRSAEVTLVQQLLPGLLLVLNRATGGDLELARELSQDTLLIVLQRLRGAGLSDGGGVAAFAAQTARNLAMADKRRRSRRRTSADLESIATTADNSPSSLEQVSDRRLGLLLSRLLDKLPSQRDRTALRRFYLLEEGKSEICRDLGIAENVFNQILFRARKKLRDLLTEVGLGRQDIYDLDSAQ